jgi:hypothetical protein
MLKIKFITEDSSPEFIKASEEYINIWEKDGQRIAKKFKELSGLDFVEKEITVVIFEGISNSGVVNVFPMKLRASNDYNHKIATLTHELGHRLLFAHGVKKTGLGIHQILDLILYDLWFDLYGKKFADEQVRRESERKNPVAPYKECWEWVLEKTREERNKFFLKIIREYEEKEALKAIRSYEREKKAGKLKIAKSAKDFF